MVGSRSSVRDHRDDPRGLAEDGAGLDSSWQGPEVMESSGPVTAQRRAFLKTASLAAASLAACPLPSSWGGRSAAPPVRPHDRGYKYRIAFGCWINDMRSEALPLQQWPAPHLD